MANSTPRTRGTTTQRGLGHKHQQARARLLARHVDGARCPWCQRPMFRDKEQNFDRRALHADHDTARSRGGTTATRLLHGSCNESRGDGLRGTTAAPNTPDPELGTLVMNWPKP